MEGEREQSRVEKGVNGVVGQCCCCVAFGRWWLLRDKTGEGGCKRPRASFSWLSVPRPGVDDAK